MYIKPINSGNYDLKGFIKLYEIEKKGGLFNWWFEKCLLFEQTGELIILSSKFDDVNVGIFLSERKRDYKNKKLSQEKFDKLIQLKSFSNWLEKLASDLNKTKLSFDDKIELAKQCELEEKIVTLTVYKGINIGRFLHKQKEKFNSNKLSEEKKLKLLEVKFWSDWIEGDDKFNKNIEFIKQYETEHKTIPKGLKVNDILFVSLMDKLKKKFKNNELLEEEEEKLSELNYWQNWLDSDKRFERLHKLIKEYELENVNTDVIVERKTVYKNIRIGQRIEKYRTPYKKNKLSEEEKEKLLELKCWKKWLDEGRDKKKLKKYPPLSEMVKIIKEYELRNGKFTTTSIHEDGAKIGAYIGRYKTKINNGINIPEDVLVKLSEIKHWREFMESKKHPKSEASD
jgi:hypothetical protein